MKHHSFDLAERSAQIAALVQTTNARMFRTVVKYAFWLLVLTYGDPNIIESVIAWVGRC